MRKNKLLIYVLLLATGITLWVAINYDFNQGGVYTLIALTSLVGYHALRKDL